MKSNILIISAMLGLLAPWHGWALGVTCMDCTNGNGKCSTYALTCCSPCQFRPVEECSGTITTEGDDCDMVETKNLVNEECRTTITYHAHKGYYSDRLACRECPTSGVAAGTTAEDGATKITQCYMPTGAAFSDGTGSGTYTGDCYYSSFNAFN